MDYFYNDLSPQQLTANLFFFCFFGKLLGAGAGQRCGRTDRARNSVTQLDKEAIMARIQMRNAVRLVGDVMDIDEKTRMIQLLTKQVRQSGTYEDQHRVLVPDAKVLGKLKPGRRIGLMGRLDRSDEKFSTIIVAAPKTIVSAKKSEGYDNICQLVGPVPFSAGMLPADDGKVSLANLAIEVGGKIFNGVAFRQLAAIYDRTWLKGAIGQLMGRLRTREFVDNEGNLQTSIEIVAEDKRETRVLRKAVVEDRFGSFGVIDDSVSDPESDQDQNQDQNQDQDRGPETAAPVPAL
jgi:hypothetical protein